MEQKEIGIRIAELRSEVGETQQQLADSLGIKRETVKFWESGDRQIKAGDIAKLALHFRVTADYILGLSSIKKRDVSHNLQEIGSYTGLSETAIEYLHTLYQCSFLPPRDKRIKILCTLLETKQFDMLLALWEQYVNLMSTITSLSYSMTPEFTMFRDTLKTHGYTIALPDDQAKALFAERITNLTRSLLDGIADKWQSDFVKAHELSDFGNGTTEK